MQRTKIALTGEEQGNSYEVKLYGWLCSCGYKTLDGKDMETFRFLLKIAHLEAPFKKPRWTGADLYRINAQLYGWKEPLPFSDQTKKEQEHWNDFALRLHQDKFGRCLSCGLKEYHQGKCEAYELLVPSTTYGE
jgi:hypothetical protein